MAITAKVICNLKVPYDDGNHDRPVTLGFCPDYANGANAEWAKATPHLDLRMTVRHDVAGAFDPGKRYTLTFAETPDAGPTAGETA